jgi:hypothetical protein
MDLPSKPVFDALASEGVSRIHHANTVLTACHFIRSKALLSRGSVEARGLKQTKQSSDGLDKRYSIWFDVFTDSVDIHARAKRANHYGPVLLVFDAAIIEEAYTGRIWVTRENPTKWQGKARENRWFQSIEELRSEFTYGTFDHMIVFRHCGGELPFGSYLKKVILDDPRMTTEEGADLFSAAYGALRLAMTDSGIDIPIERRICEPSCRCRRDYRNGPEMAYERFMPEI